MLHKLPNHFERTRLDGYYQDKATKDVYSLSGDYFISESPNHFFVCVQSYTTDNVKLMDILDMDWINPDSIESL